MLSHTRTRTRTRTRASAVAVAAALALTAGLAVTGARASGSKPGQGSSGAAWTAAWAASPQRASTGFKPNWSEDGFSGQTLR